MVPIASTEAILRRFTRAAMSVLCVHILQAAMVYVNTLMLRAGSRSAVWAPQGGDGQKQVLELSTLPGVENVALAASQGHQRPRRAARRRRRTTIWLIEPAVGDAELLPAISHHRRAR